MWWVPFLAAVVLGVIVLALHALQQRRLVRDSKSYRGRFIQLVAQLDTITRAVNGLEPHARGIKDARVLDYFEGTLKVLETLLMAVRRIPPFGSDASGLESAFFLVRDCRERVGRSQQAFQDSMRGRPVRIDALTEKKSSVTAGCYFCSRPVIPSRFAQVKVKIDGQVKEVTSCKICKDELETTKKVKVLYFMKEGQPIHWSDIADYKPSEDFWNINKPASVQKTHRLEIVRDPVPPKDGPERR